MLRTKTRTTVATGGQPVRAIDVEELAWQWRKAA